MASRSSSCRAIPVIELGFRSRKTAAFAPPASRLDSKSEELGVPEKGTSAPSHASALNHASTPALVEPILALKYSKADLIRILKICLKTKGQEPKAEVSRKRPLKAKVPDVYFGKSHIDC